MSPFTRFLTLAALVALSATRVAVAEPAAPAPVAVEATTGTAPEAGPQMRTGPGCWSRYCWY